MASLDFDVPAGLVARGPKLRTVQRHAGTCQVPSAATGLREAEVQTRSSHRDIIYPFIIIDRTNVSFIAPTHPPIQAVVFTHRSPWSRHVGCCCSLAAPAPVAAHRRHVFSRRRAQRCGRAGTVFARPRSGRRHLARLAASQSVPVRPLKYACHRQQVNVWGPSTARGPAGWRLQQACTSGRRLQARTVQGATDEDRRVVSVERLRRSGRYAATTSPTDVARRARVGRIYARLGHSVSRPPRAWLRHLMHTVSTALRGRDRTVSPAPVRLDPCLASRTDRAGCQGGARARAPRPTSSAPEQKVFVGPQHFPASPPHAAPARILRADGCASCARCGGAASRSKSGSAAADTADERWAKDSDFDESSFFCPASTRPVSEGGQDRAPTALAPTSTSRFVWPR